MMETELTRIAYTARTQPEVRFTSLVHLINPRNLEICHRELSRNKAPGIDGITKEEYEQNLETNLNDLVRRMKQQSYKPQPVRRAYIAKQGTNKMRPLGIPAYEDKLVQLALSKILNSIYEEDFLDCSFGYRPNRGIHDALKVLNRIIETKNINCILDVDIKGFFDNVDHEWLKKFVKHRIADPNIYRLIVRFLKAGVMEEGKFQATNQGTPQGGVVSPILANLYLHYVVDLWFEKVMRKRYNGKAYMVRYADDMVFCFENEETAREFYEDLVERLNRFNLEISEEKTKIIPFGKRALENKTSKTFDFLGMTHYMGRNRNGSPRVKRKTSKKKYKASIYKCKEWIKQHRNMPMREMWRKMYVKLQSYYRHYGITDNWESMARFALATERLLFKWLNRRSQRKSFTWDKFSLFLRKNPLPRLKIYVNIFTLGAGADYCK